MKFVSARRCVGVLVLALCAATFGWAAPASANETTGAIAGHLTNPDGTAATPARVDVFSADDYNWAGSGQTDETGAYRVEGLTPGEYAVQLRSPEWVTQWAYQKPDFYAADRITVVAGQTATVDDTFVEVGRISGRVLDANGNPAAERQVSAEPIDGAGQYAYAYTDDAGRYEMTVWPGEYRLAFQTPDYLLQYAPQKLRREDAGRFVVAGGDALVVDEQILANGWITGRVSDASGSPLADADVVAHTGDLYLWGRADADGRFRIAAWPGTYLVNFSTPEGVRSQYFFGARDVNGAADIVVRAGEETFIEDSLLPTGSVRVTATDAATGEPIADFCAYIEASNGCSNGTGEVLLTEVVAGRNHMAVTAEGYNDGFLEVDVTAGETVTTAIALQRATTIVTVVRDAATGAPVAGACIYPLEVGEPQLTSGHRGCSDEQGRVRIAYLKSTTRYQLYVQAPRDSHYGDQWLGKGGGTGDRLEAHAVRTEPNAIVEAPAVKLDKAGTISGVVTDAATGEPVSGGVVTITTFHPGYGVDFGADIDEAGRFTYERLGPYKWPLFIAGHGYAPQWSGGTGDRTRAAKIKVKAGATTAYDVALTTGTTVTGTVAGATECHVVAVNVKTGDSIGFGYLYPDADRYELHVVGPQRIRLECDDRVSEAFDVTGEGSLTVNF